MLNVVDRHDKTLTFPKTERPKYEEVTEHSN